MRWLFNAHPNQGFPRRNSVKLQKSENQIKYLTRQAAFMSARFKKSNQKKGDPQSGPLRGSLKKLKEPENLETSLLRSRQTSKFFNPSLSTFSSPARTGWGKVRIRGCPHPNPLPLGEGRGEGSPYPIPFPQTLGEEVRSAGQSGSGQALV